MLAVLTKIAKRLEMLGGVVNQGFAGFITMGVNTSVEVDNWWKG